MTSRYRSHVKISSQSALFWRVWKAIFTRTHITLSRFQQDKSRERGKIYRTRSVKKKLIKQRLFLLITRKYFAKFYANKFESRWINYFRRQHNSLKTDSRSRKWMNLFCLEHCPRTQNSVWPPHPGHSDLSPNVTPWKKFPQHPIKNPTLPCYLMTLLHST